MLRSDSTVCIAHPNGDELNSLQSCSSSSGRGACSPPSLGCRQGFERWLSDAEAGVSEAQFRVAKCYDDGADGAPNDQRLALLWYSRAAQGGHASANYHLGNCYAIGRGTAPDPKRAVDFWKRAAEMGLAEAQCCLGVAYSLGWGLGGVDWSQAVLWFRRAALAGNAEAQYNLGICYKKGRGVRADATQAAEWLRKAAVAGHMSSRVETVEAERRHTHPW
jgi:TPR repeat protein